MGEGGIGGNKMDYSVNKLAEKCYKIRGRKIIVGKKEKLAKTQRINF